VNKERNNTVDVDRCVRVQDYGKDDLQISKNRRRLGDFRLLS